MRKIRVLIVEDEVIVARDIAHYLNELGCEIVGILVEGEDVMPFLENEEADIVLMDINLKGKLDGVETVRLLKQKYDIPIIYLTANTDDRSFELAKGTKPYAFVEKPFKPKRLVRTVELLIEQLAEKTADSSQDEQNQFVLKDRIFIKDNGKMTKIFLADILYIEADGSYSKIRTKSKAYLLAINLRNLESKISSEVLMRVHRSFIVNLQEIESIEENYIHVDKKTIPVSRSHWSDFLNRVNVI